MATSAFHGAARIFVAGLVLAAGARAGEPAGGDKPAAEPPKPAAKPPAVFTLADGSRVTGEAQLKEIRVKTAYGELLLPIDEVLRVRVAQSSNKELREKVAALIKQLGAADFNEREKAYEALYRLAPSAMSQLREAAKHPDAEVRNRVDKLLADLETAREESEDAEVPLDGDEDEVVARRFVIRGLVQLDQCELLTRYGRLAIPREQIIAASFNRPEAETRTFKVQGGNTTNNLLATKIKVKAGDEIRLKASGTINFNNWGHTVGPDGDNERFGAQLNNIPGMALLGRIGPTGELFLIGNSKNLTVDTSGELFLGIAYQGNAGRTSGEFKVRITLASKSAR